MIKVEAESKKDFKELERLAKKASKHVESLEIPHKKIGILLDRWVHLNFKSEGGKVGGWKPFALGGRLKTLTTGKRVFDPIAKLLQDSRDLEKSFSPFWSRKTAGIGSDLPYAIKHEEGVPEDNLPKRRMLPKIAEVKAEIRKVYELYINELKSK